MRSGYRGRVALGVSLMVLACHSATAQGSKQSYGDWSSDTTVDSTGIFYAATTSATGDALEDLCVDNGKSCAWVIMSTISCATGMKMGALINSDAGSYNITLQCNGYVGLIGNGSYYSYSVAEQSTVTAAVENSQSYLGIAYPLAGGAFQADRFSMRGRLEALSQLANSLPPGPSTAPPTTSAPSTSEGSF